MSGSTRVFAAGMASETEPGLHAMSSSPLSAATTQVRSGRGRSTEATNAAGTVVHQVLRSDGRGGAAPGVVYPATLPRRRRGRGEPHRPLRRRLPARDHPRVTEGPDPPG